MIFDPHTSSAVDANCTVARDINRKTALTERANPFQLLQLHVHKPIRFWFDIFVKYLYICTQWFRWNVEPLNEKKIHLVKAKYQYQNELRKD